MSEVLSEPASSNNQPPTREVPRVLPDVAQDSIAPISRTLDRVGMSGIELAVLWQAPNGVALRVPARADASVSLDDADSRGIHMSRLYLALQQSLDNRPLSPQLLREAIATFVTSHAGISQSARVSLEFEHLVQRKSLLSELRGWRSYPIRFEAWGKPEAIRQTIRFGITYSSTCPCSAALARQLIQQRFLENFGDSETVSTEQVANWLSSQRAIAALPHSQRSHAEVLVRLDDRVDDYPLDALIDRCEDALRTPVQAAVKRVDEQEFARLNGEHLMFCEDAARILADALDASREVVDYRIRVRHLESLHPHDAVATVTKGLPGGWTAES